MRSPTPPLGVAAVHLAVSLFHAPVQHLGPQLLVIRGFQTRSRLRTHNCP